MVARSGTSAPLSSNTGWPWRLPLVLALATGTWACGTGDTASELDAADATSCREPETLSSPADHLADVVAARTWVEVTSVEVSSEPVAELGADAAGLSESDIGALRERSPDGLDHVLRVEAAARRNESMAESSLLATEKVAAGAESALEADSELWIGAFDMRATALSFTGDGGAVFYGNCMNDRYLPEAHRFLDAVAAGEVNGAPRVSTPEELVRALLSDRTGTLRDVYDRWFSPSPPPAWEELDPRQRTLDDPSVPADVLDAHHFVMWRVELTAELPDVGEFAMCPRVATGWNSCVPLDALEPSQPVTIPIYVPSDSTEVEFWLFDEPLNLLEPAAALGSVLLSDEPTVVTLVIEGGTARDLTTPRPAGVTISGS
jgi:hypothetical protein